jgi:hypothetical protein
MTTASLGKIVLKHVGLITLGALIALPVKAQQLPEVTIVTAVNNMAFSAVWVAEQLKYFEQEGVRALPVVGGRTLDSLLRVEHRGADPGDSRGSLISRGSGP